MSSLSRNSSVQVFSEAHERSVHEIRVNLSQLRPRSTSTALRSKSYTHIGESLLERHKKSQARIGAQRIRKKSMEFEDFTFIPKICRKRYKTSQPKYTKKVKELYENIQRIEENKKDVIRKALRPRDVIDGPDLTNAKDLFNSRTVRKTGEEKENPWKMSLTEKTNFFWKKRQAGIRKAALVKVENGLKECTFRPDLRKVLRKEASIGRIEGLRTQDVRGKESLSRQSTLSRANSYYKISPDEQNYSFREGMNVKRFIEKSKPMLRYSSVTKC